MTDTRFWMKAAAVFIAAVAAYMDIKTRKIPNKLTFRVMALGMAANLILGGLPGGIGSVLGISMGFCGFLLFAVGAMKAGDIKLYMALGALVGWRSCAGIMIFSILFGGAAGLLISLFQKGGMQRLRNLKNYVINMFLTKSVFPYCPDESSYFSFGVCIFAGVLIEFIYEILL